MTGASLISEGERLARPCVYLRAQGTELAALWGGGGLGKPPAGPFRHWLSIDSSFLPHNDIPPGVLDIFTNEDDCISGCAVMIAGAKLARNADATALFAHRDRSLPPIDAIFRFGSTEVQQWLEVNNWDSTWGYNSNFSDSVPAEEYERYYQQHLPLYTGDAHAVLGGWHMPWPEDDWEELLDKQLIVWTFEDSEPWVEAWRQEDAVRVIQRAT